MTVIKKLNYSLLTLSKLEKKDIKSGPNNGFFTQRSYFFINQYLSFDEVWVSIFVNLTQFNDINDYKKYPVNSKEDINIINPSTKIYIFIPSIDDIYGKKLLGISTTLMALIKYSRY